MPEEIKTSEQRHKLYRHSQLGPCIKCIVTQDNYNINLNNSAKNMEKLQKQEERPKLFRVFLHIYFLYSLPRYYLLVSAL